MITRSNRRWLAWVLAALLLAAGCATVPSGGLPVDYTRVADPDNPVKQTGPELGLSPLETVRGFIAASARVDQDLTLTEARSYLTADANKVWWAAPSAVMILAATPRFDVLPDQPADVQLSGATDGYLAADGSFVPTSRQSFSAIMRVVQVEGQWRIENPPDALVMYVGDFNLAFTQRQVYFVNHPGTLVVPDRRWLPNSSLYPLTMAGQLFDRLVRGPSASLDGAVVNELAGARLRVPISAGSDGVLQVDLTGLPSLSPTATQALAAQLVYTLSSDAGRIRILVDGAPLDTTRQIWTTAVLGAFDPDGVPGSGSPGAVGYYLNNDGVLVNLAGEPVWGSAGASGLQGVSAAMSAATGALAIVGTDDDEETLYIGDPLTDVAMEARLSATSFTPPSFSRAGDEVWTVTNGGATPEVVRLLTAGSRFPVDSAALAGIGPISGLTLSPDGARVALVAGAKLYLSTVSYAQGADPSTPNQGSAGSETATLGPPVMLRSELTVGSAIWADSQNILVAASDTSSTYRAVWQVGLDGRQRSLLTTRGIIADVDAVAATGALPTLISSGGQIYQLRGDDSTGEWVSANPNGQPAEGRWPLYPA